MTPGQLHLFNAGYLVLFIVVAVLTRATARRVAGAAAGGAIGGVAALGAIVVGETNGWWHMAIDTEPYPLTLLLLDFTLSGFIFLGTWRLARRFGWRGLAVTATLVAIVGPIRDYLYMAWFPEWGAYTPGAAPVVAVSATYLLIGVTGHAVMRLVAGPARGSRLAHSGDRG